MQLERILEVVSRKVQDSSYDNSDYIEFINMCLGEIASTEAMPKLIENHVVTVPAGQHTVDLPEGLYSGPFWAYNQTIQGGITVYDKLTIFLQRFKHLDEAGPVRFLINAGNELMVQYSPHADQEIKVWYSREPQKLEDEDDEDYLFWLPYHLRGQLLINYCCMQAFSEIEDGVETRGSMPNFEKYHALYVEARGMLRQHLGVPDGSPEFIPDVPEAEEDI